MKSRRIYRLENVSSGDYFYTHASSRKEAHDMSISAWPGQTVEVCTETEYQDRETYRSHQNQILDLLEGVEGYIPDGNYPDALRCLESVKLRVQELEIYFENRLQAGLAGEGVVS